MAKNFKYSGARVTVKNLAATVAAGTLVRQRGILGIPQDNALQGGSVLFGIEGVWGLTFAAYAGGQPAAGCILFWDTSANALSIGSANDDFAAVKCITAVSASDGSFEGLLLPTANGRPVGQDQA